MDRPHLVYVGGTEGQEIECLYLGTDGEKAQAIFDEAGNDGRNAVVRYCCFFEHRQIRTPKRDGVPPKSSSSPGSQKAKGKTSRATAAPAADVQEAPADTQEASGGDASAQEHDI